MLRLAQRLVLQATSRRLLIAFAVFASVQVAFGWVMADPAVAAVIDAMPDIHLGYDGAGLVSLIGRLAEDPATTRFVYGVDLLNPTTGAALFGTALARLLVATQRERSGWARLVLVPAVGCVLDLVENAVVLVLVALHPSEIVAWSWLPLTILTVSKFTCHLTSLASVLVLGAEASWVRVRGLGSG